MSQSPTSFSALRLSDSPPSLKDPKHDPISQVEKKRECTPETESDSAEDDGEAKSPKRRLLAIEQNEPGEASMSQPSSPTKTQYLGDAGSNGLDVRKYAFAITKFAREDPFWEKKELRIRCTRAQDGNRETRRDSLGALDDSSIDYEKLFVTDTELYNGDYHCEYLVVGYMDRNAEESESTIYSEEHGCIGERKIIPWDTQPLLVVTRLKYDLLRDEFRSKKQEDGAVSNQRRHDVGQMRTFCVMIETAAGDLLPYRLTAEWKGNKWLQHIFFRHEYRKGECPPDSTISGFWKYLIDCQMGRFLMKWEEQQARRVKERVEKKAAKQGKHLAADSPNKLSVGDKTEGPPKRKDRFGKRGPAKKQSNRREDGRRSETG